MQSALCSWPADLKAKQQLQGQAAGGCCAGSSGQHHAGCRDCSSKPKVGGNPASRDSAALCGSWQWQQQSSTVHYKPGRSVKKQLQWQHVSRAGVCEAESSHQALCASPVHSLQHSMVSERLQLRTKRESCCAVLCRADLYRYSHLVYNGSVHYWHVASLLQCDKLRHHLLPSQEKLCQVCCICLPQNTARTGATRADRHYSSCRSGVTKRVTLSLAELSSAAVLAQ